MNYFDIFDTEDEIDKIEKLDCLYTKDIVSLDDEETQKKLACYAYEMYLREKNKKSSNDKKGGYTCD